MEAVPRERGGLCRIPREELLFLRQTPEGYDGVCGATTLPGREGRVRLLTTADRRGELEAGLAAEMDLGVASWAQEAPPVGGPP